jgi:transposase InsO family protein
MIESERIRLAPGRPPGCVIDCCTREIVGWNSSHRCRTDAGVAAVEQVVLNRSPARSREMDFILTTSNGTQFTSSRCKERWHNSASRIGGWLTHREGNSYIELFHRSADSGRCRSAFQLMWKRTYPGTSLSHQAAPMVELSRKDVPDHPPYVW